MELEFEESTPHFDVPFERQPDFQAGESGEPRTRASLWPLKCDQRPASPPCASLCFCATVVAEVAGESQRETEAWRARCWGIFLAAGFLLFLGDHVVLEDTLNIHEL